MPSTISSSRRTSSNNNLLQDELLALLDNDQAMSCNSGGSTTLSLSSSKSSSRASSSRGGSHLHSRRGGGGGGGLRGLSGLGIGAGGSSSLASLGSRGNRSVPTSFKYWASTAPPPPSSGGSNSSASGNNNNNGSRRRKGHVSSPRGQIKGYIRRLKNFVRIQSSKLSTSFRQLTPVQLIFFVTILSLTWLNLKITRTNTNHSSSISNNNDNDINQLRHVTLSSIDQKNDIYIHSNVQFAFIDTSWPGRESVQFETFVQPSQLDFGTQHFHYRERLMVEEENVKRCDDILLFVPTRDYEGDSSGHYGGGGVNEINDYLLAALLATYTDKAMVLLDPPSQPLSSATNEGVSISGNSWFDGSCPLNDDMLHEQHQPQNESGNTTTATTSSNTPTGLSRLIQHPSWLSHSCPIPCQTTYTFRKWNKLLDSNIHEVTCQNDNDRMTKVFVVNGEDVRREFLGRYKNEMTGPLHSSQSSSKQNSEQGSLHKAQLYQWAIRLGAKGHEAQTFAYKLQTQEELWDYVAALMARSGIVRLQPWMARDVKAYVKEQAGVPMNWPYVGILVYRDEEDDAHGGNGAPLLEMTDNGESNGFLAPLQSTNEKEAGSSSSSHTSSIPFHKYLHSWTQSNKKCSDTAHPIYIVTNHPQSIQEEINKLPKGQGGNVILGECHRLRFMFSPGGAKPIQQQLLGVDGDGATHQMDCAKLHRSVVATMADLMILAKSDTFILDDYFSSSNNGDDEDDISHVMARLVRVFRTSVNNLPGRREDGPVLVRDTKVVGNGGGGGVAGGRRHPGPPGM